MDWFYFLSNQLLDFDLSANGSAACLGFYPARVANAIHMLSLAVD